MFTRRRRQSGPRRAQASRTGRHSAHRSRARGKRRGQSCGEDSPWQPLPDKRQAPETARRCQAAAAHPRRPRCLAAGPSRPGRQEKGLASHKLSHGWACDLRATRSTTLHPSPAAGPAVASLSPCCQSLMPARPPGAYLLRCPAAPVIPPKPQILKQTTNGFKCEQSWTRPWLQPLHPLASSRPQPWPWPATHPILSKTLPTLFHQKTTLRRLKSKVRA